MWSVSTEEDCEPKIRSFLKEYLLKKEDEVLKEDVHVVMNIP
jgi:hypothetical protein